MSANTDLQTYPDHNVDDLTEIMRLSPPNQSNMVAVEAHRAVAEIQAALIVADTRPRDPAVCVANILRECEVTEVAEKAIYRVQRGNTFAIGPSIRLAEVLVRNWPHLHCTVEMVEFSDKKSTWRAVVWDAQSNSRKTIVETIRHVRYSKAKGNTELTNPDEIYEVCMSKMARRLRNCILAMIPTYVTEKAMAKCRQVKESRGDLTWERVQKMLEAFARVGVTQAMIEKWLGYTIDRNNLPEKGHVITLGEIYNSIESGETTVDRFFESLHEEGKTPAGEALNDKVQSQREKVASARTKKPAEPPAPQPAASPAQTPLMPFIEQLNRTVTISQTDTILFEVQLLYEDGQIDEASWRDFFDAVTMRREELGQ